MKNYVSTLVVVVVFGIAMLTTDARRSVPQLRQMNVASVGQSSTTGLVWNITPVPGDQYRVEFTIPNFMASSWVAMGFGPDEFMPNSFIIMCAKGGDGQVVVQQRYALARMAPPVFDWGVRPQSSEGDPNKCAALIPTIIKNPAGQEFNLASRGRDMFVKTARGPLISGRPAYHGLLKESVGTLQFV